MTHVNSYLGRLHPVDKHESSIHRDVTSAGDCFRNKKRFVGREFLKDLVRVYKCMLSVKRLLRRKISSAKNDSIYVLRVRSYVLGSSVLSISSIHDPCPFCGGIRLGWEFGYSNCHTGKMSILSSITWFCTSFCVMVKNL